MRKLHSGSTNTAIVFYKTNTLCACTHNHSPTNANKTIVLFAMPWLGLQAGMEEYWDYIFPEEAGAAPHLKLLELAYKHKRQKLDTSGL